MTALTYPVAGQPLFRVRKCRCLYLILAINAPTTPERPQPSHPTATRTAINENWPLAVEGQFRSKSFILLVPGGGVEPPRGCPRRILSPFFALLQAFAWSRRNVPIASIHRGFSDYGLLHRIAPNRTKFRYKPAPKPAPELCPFFAIAPVGLPLQWRRFRNGD